MEPKRARLTHWFSDDGEIVGIGDLLFTIETDKGSVDVPAPQAGRVRQLARVGDVVAPGDEVVRIDAVD